MNSSIEQYQLNSINNIIDILYFALGWCAIDVNGHHHIIYGTARLRASTMKKNSLKNEHFRLYYAIIVDNNAEHSTQQPVPRPDGPEPRLGCRTRPCCRVVGVGKRTHGCIKPATVKVYNALAATFLPTRSSRAFWSSFFFFFTKTKEKKTYLAKRTNQIGPPLICCTTQLSAQVPSHTRRCLFACLQSSSGLYHPCA